MRRLGMLMNVREWAELSSLIFWVAYMRIHNVLPVQLSSRIDRLYNFTAGLFYTLVCK